MIIGYFFVCITGSLLHFTYEWSNNNFIIGLFSAVSESTWEHMKLLFFPMLVYALFCNYKLKKDYPCILSAFSFGILLGTFLIPVIFYTYSGILGRNYQFLDLATFFISVLAAFFATYRLTLSCKFASYTPILKAVIFIVMVFFWIFTYFAPNIGLFIAP